MSVTGIYARAKPLNVRMIYIGINVNTTALFVVDCIQWDNCWLYNNYIIVIYVAMRRANYTKLSSTTLIMYCNCVYYIYIYIS